VAWHGYIGNMPRITIYSYFSTRRAASNVAYGLSPLLFHHGNGGKDYGRFRTPRCAMPDLQKLQQYMILVDQLVEVTEKEDIAECARLLAMNVAHYKRRYGELPLEDHLSMIVTDDINDEQAELVIDGMETLVGMLGTVIEDVEKVEH